MSQINTTEVHYSDVINGLMTLADNVMNERRITMLNYDDSDENQRLLDLHDRLVIMAREMSEFFEDGEEIVTEPVEHTAGSIAGEITTYLPEEWTLSDLAKAAKVNKGTLDRIMSGETTRPQAKTLRKIEASLGMEEGHLDADA